jgi:hypothetical protein
MRSYRYLNFVRHIRYRRSWVLASLEVYSTRDAEEALCQSSSAA